MVKSINWPRQFREEVLAESPEKLCCALRLGRLYYDNQYWAADEEILVRVNHKVIRKGTVAGDLKCCPIQQLEQNDLNALKSGLNSVEAVANFLSQTYDQPVDPDTEVTVVYYRNHPIDPDILEVEDDSHM